MMRGSQTEHGETLGHYGLLRLSHQEGLSHQDGLSHQEGHPTKKVFPPGRLSDTTDDLSVNLLLILLLFSINIIITVNAKHRQAHGIIHAIVSSVRYIDGCFYVSMESIDEE